MTTTMTMRTMNPISQIVNIKKMDRFFIHNNSMAQYHLINQHILYFEHYFDNSKSVLYAISLVVGQPIILSKNTMTPRSNLPIAILITKDGQGMAKS